MELFCAFLPQAGFLLPLAAFFVPGLLWLWRGGASRGYGLCLLLGALLGLGSTVYSTRQLTQAQQTWAGREVWLSAEVEHTSASYYPGVVRAVLRVEQADGQDAAFRVEAACLPKCTAGERVEGRFALDGFDETSRLSAWADGVALSGEVVSGFARRGVSRSFRARTARLQSRLSVALRKGMPQEEAGVLAAMVLGDRSTLSKVMNTAYRDAGLSHVLVVSGMHVTILCGGFLERFRRRERSWLSRWAGALVRAAMALILVGVTGFGPSVIRAAVAVWIASAGVWLGCAPDALTSLAAAGIVMTLGNSYAVCDVGFELSFAAVVGTLAGAELVRAGGKKAVQGPRWKRLLARGGRALWETLCVSACASAATFPVLVLRGLSASLYALLSSVAVLWMVEPILLLGLAAAFLGLWPQGTGLYRLAAGAAVLLTGWMDRWAVWVSGLPGAVLCFDTAYAALVCLGLLFLGWLAYQWKLRLRVALPALALTALLAVGVGNALSRDVVRVELAGSRNAPAIVLTKGESAVVLYRGGDSARQSVERILMLRGVRTTELVIDLRMDAKTPCGLTAQQTIAVSAMGRYATRTVQCGPAALEVLRTYSGGVVRIRAAGRTLVTLSGSVKLARPLRADWLLASAARPDAVRWQSCLTLSDRYRWMEQPMPTAHRLTLRPGGGSRVDGNAFQSAKSVVQYQ